MGMKLAEPGSQVSTPYPDDLPPCPESRRIALAMLACKPTAIPTPELGYDPDGETCLDWRRYENDLVSVRVSATGKLAVAWANEANDHGPGSFVSEFHGRWPIELVDIILLVFPPPVATMPEGVKSA